MVVWELSLFLHFVNGACLVRMVDCTLFPPASTCVMPTASRSRLLSLSRAFTGTTTLSVSPSIDFGSRSHLPLSFNVLR